MEKELGTEIVEDIDVDVTDDVTPDPVVDGEVADDEVDADPAPEVSYSKSQVESIIKTRIGTYKGKIDKLATYKGLVDQISEITGLPTEELSARLSSMSAEQQASILGISPEQAKAIKASKVALDMEKKNNQILSRQLEENTLKADSKFKDFDLFKEDIDSIIEENPRLSLKQAYILAKGDDAISSAARDAEQRAIAKTVNAQTKKVLKPQGTATPASAKLDANVIAAAKAVGMDPAEYAKYMVIDNIDAHRASKKK